MDISPTNFPVMRLLGTKDAVDFVSLLIFDLWLRLYFKVDRFLIFDLNILDL